jgi:hypothetical protein
VSGRRKPQPVQLPGLEEDQSPLAIFAREVEEAGEAWRLAEGRSDWDNLMVPIRHVAKTETDE